MYSTGYVRYLTPLLIAVLLAGCSGNISTPSPVPFPATTALRENLELEHYFEDLSGAVVIYDLNQDRYSRYNPEQCAERLLPASTFKILNSLIGLETGVISDENEVIPWDGTQHPIASWNQDHTLKTAIQNSVVWYYQELARRVERERMQKYIDAVGYGNREIRGPIDAFWLDGSLQISADEQVEFLKRLYRGDLPFSERSMKIVREILVLETTDAYRLSGKTGSGQAGGTFTGWFVGYVEQAGNVYFFAVNIQGTDAAINGLNAKAIAMEILQDLGILSSDCGCS